MDRRRRQRLFRRFRRLDRLFRRTRVAFARLLGGSRDLVE
jgi:hypothetical protein